jgi:hypothetical protein
MLVRVPVSGDGGCESNTDESSLVPRQALVEARKGSKRLGTETSTITIYPETVHIASDQSSPFRRVDFSQERSRFEFPRVDDVIPSQETIREVPSECRVRVNAEYLVKLLKALGTPSEVEIVLGAGMPHSIKVNGESKQKAVPVILQSYSDTEPKELTGAFGLLMPIEEPK